MVLYDNWFCSFCLFIFRKFQFDLLRRLDFFMTLVLQSWRMSGLYRKEEEEGKRNARRALAMSSLKLSESMAKKTTAFVKPHFQAWEPWQF